MLRRATSLALVAAALAGSGCYRGSARTVSMAEIGKEPGWTLVPNVRVIRQESEHTCGVAALAMVFDRWGVADAAEEARKRLPMATDHGISAGALRQAARERGFRAHLVVGQEADLFTEVRASRPVLVGLVQRYNLDKALTHYEVVVGVNEPRRRVLLLDPGRGVREDALESFDKEWKDAGRLTLVVAPS